MNYRELIQHKELILLDCISGSTSYDLHIEGSDLDKKGIFIMSQKQLYGFERTEQIANDTTDEVYYEVGRFLELLTKNNPGILELLCTPKEHIIFRNPLMDLIKAEDFLSKLCQDTFVGYAQTQIRKAGNSNKSDYIPKKMMHGFRLLNMAEEIALYKQVIIKRDDREFLLNIRKGVFEFEYLMELIPQKIAQIKRAYENSDLTDRPSIDLAENILVEIRQNFYQKPIPKV